MGYEVVVKYKIKLFSSHNKDAHIEQPQWWRNFVNANSLTHNNLNKDELNETLKPYKAKFRHTIKHSPYGIRYITFDTEADALLFMVKWS